MKKSKLIVNSFAAIGQVLIVGIVYFLLYRYLLETIGIKLLGVWSLIIATTSVALIANFGISTSIIKFVSTYYTRKDYESLKKLIFTASVFMIITYTLISLLLLWLGEIILSHFIEPDYLEIALKILPFSLISLVLNALGGVISSCLDGIQKNYIRSYILSLSSIFLLITSIVLTPKYGLQGLIFAQILQSLLVLILSLFLISRQVKGVIAFKWNWSKAIFREIINYGLKMQALSFMQMLYEPVTKAFLSKYGGLEMVGFYEMGNRLVSQFRSLIVSANQVVIPVVAEAQETNTSYVKEIYLKTFSAVFILDIVLVSGIIITAPLVSYLWIGEIVPFFIFTVIVNSCFVFINICSNPAYFSYLGEGKLNWLIYSYISVSVLNILLGYFLGINFSGYGVVIGWNIAMLSGSIIVIGSFHRINGIRWAEMIDKNDFVLIILAVISCYLGNTVITNNFNKKNDYIFITLFVIILIFFMRFFLTNKNFIFLASKMKNFIKK